MSNPTPDDFVKKPLLAVPHLRSIRDEGARFNVGATCRNFNDATLALQFLWRRA